MLSNTSTRRHFHRHVALQIFPFTLEGRVASNKSVLAQSVLSLVARTLQASPLDICKDIDDCKVNRFVASDPTIYFSVQMKCAREVKLKNLLESSGRTAIAGVQLEPEHHVMTSQRLRRQAFTFDIASNGIVERKIRDKRACIHKDRAC